MTPNRACTVPECSRKHYARGLCHAHYQRVSKYGSVFHPTMGTDLTPFKPRGDGNDYKTTHGRRSLRDPASTHACVDCGNQAQHWSYEYGCSDELQSEYGPYCLHDEHYVPRCIPCHTAQAIPRGEGHYRAQLTEDLVRFIRQEYASGKTQADLMRLTGVNRKQIHKVVQRQTWKHVD